MKRPLITLFSACFMLISASALAQTAAPSPSQVSDVNIQNDELNAAQNPELIAIIAEQPREPEVLYIDQTNTVAPEIPEFRSVWQPGFQVSAMFGANASLFQVVHLWVSMGGISGGVELGYIWNTFGLYLEQKFNGLWRVTAVAHDQEAESDQYSGLTGRTGLNFRWHIPVADRLRLSLGFGLSLFYNIDDGSNDDDDYDDDDDDDTSVAPLLGLHLGLAYQINEHLAVGGRFDYSGFFLFIIGYHQFEPSVFVTYTF